MPRGRVSIRWLCTVAGLPTEQQALSSRDCSAAAPFYNISVAKPQVTALTLMGTHRGGTKMNNLVCGHCGSADIQKASVIYDGGTSTGSSVSAGAVGGRSALMSTSSSSQTNLAKKLAPPPRMAIMAMIGFALLALISGFSRRWCNLMSGNSLLGA